MRETNWAGTHTYRAGSLHRPSTIEELQELVARAPRPAGARVAPRLQRHRRLRRARVARRAAAGRRGRLERRNGLLRAGLRYGELAEELHAAAARAAQPGLAAAHLGGRRGRHGDPRLRRRQRQPGHRRRRPRAGHGRRRLLAVRRGDPDFDGWSSGSARSARSPGSPWTSSRPTRCASRSSRVSLGRRCRPLRRDHACGYSVSLFTHLGATRRAAVGQDARRSGRAGCRRAASARRRPRSSCTRSPARPGQLHRRSSACPGPGTTGCRTSGWASRPSSGEEIQSEYHVPARARARRARGAARRSRDGRAAAPGVGGPHRGRRQPLAEPAARARHRLAALHLDARARGGRAGADRGGGRARAVRLPARTGARCSWPAPRPRAPLRAGRRLRAARRPARPRRGRSPTPGSSAPPARCRRRCCSTPSPWPTTATSRTTPRSPCWSTATSPTSPAARPPARSSSTRHGWGGTWRSGIFPFHHFHSVSHEVLGIVSGTAGVILGGPQGRRLDVRAGDVLVLPAGTGHCREAAAPTCWSSAPTRGARRPRDLRRGEPDERHEVRANIARVALPEQDPVEGPDGSLGRLGVDVGGRTSVRRRACRASRTCLGWIRRRRSRSAGGFRS